MTFATLLQLLRRRYRREMFTPTILGVFINPYYIIRNGIFCGILSKRQYLTGRLLDFGCGNQPYRDYLSFGEYVGLDVEDGGHGYSENRVDVIYDGHRIPFADEHFDSILSTEVFEHVFNLHDVLCDLHRVLKPGSYLVATLPFVWEEHGIPYDFARYSTYGIRHVLTQAGFEVISIDKATHYVATLFQLLIAYVDKYLLPHRVAHIILVVVIVAPLTILGLLLSRVLPSHDDLYLNNVIVARKPEPCRTSGPSAAALLSH